MLFVNVVGTPSKVLIRRSCIEKVGCFDENLTYYVDYDFFLRFAKHFHFDCIPMPLVKYNIHENNLTKNLSIMETSLKQLRIKYSVNNGSEKIHNSFYSNAYLDIGTKLCRYGDTNKGRKILRMAIKYNPYGWRSYFNISTSIFGKNFFNYINNIKSRISKYLYIMLLNNIITMLISFNYL